MIIILEGPDGAGKTTFFEQLRNELLERSLTFTEYQRGPLHGDPFVEYEYPLESEVSVLCDRWHWGELVYGPVLRDGSKLDAAGFRHVEMFLAARGAIVVHITAPWAVLETRLRERGDDLISVNDIGHILAGYTIVAGASLLGYYGNTRTFDTGNVQGEVPGIGPGSAHSIVDTAVAQARIVDKLSRFPSYIGPPNPECLLLGQRPGEGPNSNRYPVQRAAFVPRASTSGRYLLNALPVGIIGTCGIANAEVEDIAALHQVLGYPRVVALGRDASRSCMTADVLHGIVPHPQYARRFHFSKYEQYGELIYGCAWEQEDYGSWPN